MTQQKINNTSMLRVGTILRGIYRIDSYLSSGGFGNTYVATNIEFDERVAIKEFFMKSVTQRDDDQTTVSVSNAENSNTFLEQKEKFKKEARRIRQLKNEHIVAVHDLFEENGTAYYVMDYVDGENLSERLKETGRPMTEPEVRLILPQILDALKTVHDAGIWHLDLKPANIMLEKGGNIKLIDFGASKQLNAQKGGATTSTAISYTNGYAPREQMEQNYDKFGPWTDLYALGATLYNLLTNKRPPLPTDIDDDITEDKHVALPFQSGVSEQMKTLVCWLAQTNRMKRPQSVSDLTNIITSLLTEDGFVEPKDEGHKEEFIHQSNNNIIESEETIITNSQSVQKENVIIHNQEKNNNPSSKSENINRSKSENKANTVLNSLIAILVILILGTYFFLPTNNVKDHVGLTSQYSTVRLDNQIDSLSYSLGMAQTNGLKEYLSTKLNVDTTYIDDFSNGLVFSANNTGKEMSEFCQGVSVGQQLINIADSIEKTFYIGEGKIISREGFISGFIYGVRNNNSLMTKTTAEQLIEGLTSKQNQQ